MAVGAVSLAPTGSTGNVTGAAVAMADDQYPVIAFQFVVEAVGATPTVTFKFQGTLDGTNWYDLGYITDASDTISQATQVRTTVGASVEYVSNPVARRFNSFRVVTTLNTNVTYRAEAYPLSR